MSASGPGDLDVAPGAIGGRTTLAEPRAHPRDEPATPTIDHPDRHLQLGER